MTSLPSILVVALALLVPLLEAREAVNIRGAFYSGGVLFLFNDQFQVLGIESDGSSTVYDQSLFGAPDDYVLTAAYYETAFFGLPQFVFLGDESIYRGRLLEFSTDQPSMAYRLPDFLWHAVDAATTEGRQDYFFKGCDYITSNRYGRLDTEPRSTSDLGVPCDVDAAWNDGSNTLVLKGNQVWVVGGDVNSPMAFDTYRSQNKWEL